MGKRFYYVAGFVAAAGAAFGIGVRYSEDIKDIQARIAYATDRSMERNPALRRTIDVLAYPERKARECIFGQEEAQRTEQEQTAEIERRIQRINRESEQN
jgi:hypothetical protein